MSGYLIRWDAETYANNELFIEAVAGGERSFMKMLSERTIVGKRLLDQLLYPLTAEQEARCREYSPIEQDFDAAYRSLNVLSRETVQRVKANMEAGYPNSLVITIASSTVPPLYTYRHVTFFKALDYKEHRKYVMAPKMAVVKVCGRLYVGIDAVNVRVDTPIIVTLGS